MECRYGMTGIGIEFSRIGGTLCASYIVSLLRCIGISSYGRRGIFDFDLTSMRMDWFISTTYHAMRCLESISPKQQSISP